jgi:hypothetical protein
MINTQESPLSLKALDCCLDKAEKTMDDVNPNDFNWYMNMAETIITDLELKKSEKPEHQALIKRYYSLHVKKMLRLAGELLDENFINAFNLMIFSARREAEQTGIALPEEYEQLKQRARVRAERRLSD